jgi:hypothetical protein
VYQYLKIIMAVVCIFAGMFTIDYLSSGPASGIAVAIVCTLGLSVLGLVAAIFTGDIEIPE